MAKFGCTTPFGINLNTICTDQTKGKLALDLLRELRSLKNIKSCLYPCTNLKIRLDKIEFAELNGTTRVKLIFDQFIRITSLHISYTGLELVAEVGGYVGLFLGFSVFQLSHAIKFLTRKFE